MRREPRLQFTKEERENPALEKPIRKVDRAADRADEAQVKVPKRKVKQRTVDPETGAVTVRLQFEDKKPPSKLQHALRDAPADTVLGAVHREVRQSEADNVGVESAHKTEEAAESAGRLVRAGYRSQKLRPYRKAAAAERKLEKANVNALYQKSLEENPGLSSNPLSRWQQKQAIKRQYAAARHALYTLGKRTEILVGYEPAFRFFAEWWKQLYGESEGKEEKGLFPASVDFTADLHSMGQYIQQGERMLMETVVRFAPAEQQMVVPFDEANGDGLNFLAGKTMDFINRQAMDGTLLAHVEGGVPNIILNLDENNARTMGQLIYFFEYACGLSGYLLGVNPFDQPGVEAYKKNMFALLGKPGYEEMGEALRKRLR